MASWDMAPKKKSDIPADPNEPVKPQRVVIRALNPMDWDVMLADAADKHWRVLRITIQVRHWLLAGKPASLKAADAMLKARDLAEFVAEAKDIVDPVERAAAAEAISNTEGLCEFNRREGRKGIWVPSNNVKAGIKENHSVLGLRNDVRGSRGALAEGIFVCGPGGGEESDWLYVGEAPAGVHESVTHSIGPTGPRTAIKRNEYVIRPRIEFDLIVANALSVSEKISDTELADVLIHYGEHGLGASRSQGYGRFDVEGVKEVKWPKRQLAAMLASVAS